MSFNPILSQCRATYKCLTKFYFLICNTGDTHQLKCIKKSRKFILWRIKGSTRCKLIKIVATIFFTLLKAEHLTSLVNVLKTMKWRMKSLERGKQFHDFFSCLCIIFLVFECSINKRSQNKWMCLCNDKRKLFLTLTELIIIFLEAYITKKGSNGIVYIFQPSRQQCDRKSWATCVVVLFSYLEFTC